MTKQELIDQVAENLDESPSVISRVVGGVIDEITESLVGGEEVALPPLGKFETRHRNARTAKNPQTGEPVNVPAKYVPAFKPAKALKDAVAG